MGSQVTPPASPAEVARAREAHARERLEHVLAVGGPSPRQGLEAILVRYPDAVPLLNEFIGLCELHSYRQMTAVFLRTLRSPGTDRRLVAARVGEVRSK